MPITTNYGWLTPVIDGSTGSWDTILNAAFVSADASLRAAENEAEAAQTTANKALTENLAFPLLSAYGAQYASFNGAEPVDIRRVYNTGGVGGITLVGSGAQSVNYVIPITGLKPGMRITGFRSYAIEPANTVITINLVYAGENGIDSVISSHSHGLSLEILTKTGLSHDIVANRTYFFGLDIVRITGSNSQPLISWVQPTVIRI